MPCTKDTRRCDHSTSYLHSLGPCCRSHIRTMVIEVGKLLDTAGVPWWIDYGTLLGAVRGDLPGVGHGKGIIPWDKDADCGFFITDAPKFRALMSGYREDPRAPTRPTANLQAGKAGLLYVIEKRPNRSHDQWGAGNSFKVHWSAYNRTCCDYFGWHLNESGLVYREKYVSVDKYKGREFPVSRLLPLGRIEWEGAMLPCPADPEWFVEHRYGKGWRTPLRKNNAGVKR